MNCHPPGKGGHIGDMLVRSNRASYNCTDEFGKERNEMSSSVKNPCNIHNFASSILVELYDQIFCLDLEFQRNS